MSEGGRGNTESKMLEREAQLRTGFAACESRGMEWHTARRTGGHTAPVQGWFRMHGVEEDWRGLARRDDTRKMADIYSTFLTQTGCALS